jgi:hypothetical protein
MKNIIIINIFVLLGFGCVNALSATKSVFPITFVVHWDNPSQLQNPPAHLPAYSPNVTLEDHTLHFYYDHPDCTVQLLEGDDVVFEVPFFPYTANNINLPAALSGQYELRIVEVGYYFSAVIELE